MIRAVILRRKTLPGGLNFLRFLLVRAKVQAVMHGKQEKRCGIKPAAPYFFQESRRKVE
jgi:hypothetical protein